MRYKELLNEMRKFNDKHGIERKVDTKKRDDGTIIQMIGAVVIKQGMFKRPCSVLERTYEFSNYNKALTSNDLGYSIFAHCSDGDVLRIEYLDDEHIEDAYVVKVNE